MSKEKEEYRAILEQIVIKYGKHVLTVNEAMEFTGKGRKWCRTHLGITGPVTAENLALKLSEI